MSKIYLFEKLPNCFPVLIKILKIRDNKSIGLSFLRHFMQKIGCNLKIQSRRAIILDPYFASKSAGYDVTLSFAANLW